MLNDNDYFKMVLEVLRDNGTSFEISRELCSKVFTRIGEKIGNDRIVNTQEICDDVLACFDYYNEFVTSKNINVALIEDQHYENVVAGINFAVEVIKSGEY